MGILITFEGAEGSGKTTQIRMLAAALSQSGYRIMATREPGGTRIGDTIRNLLLDHRHVEMSPRAETLLFQAARAQIVDEVIRPALTTGAIVLCDRYADSTLAYQGYGRGQPLETLKQLGDYATDHLLPALTIYLDIDVREGLARKRASAPEEWNRMENLDIEFHQRVRKGYLALAAAEPERWLVLDASQPIEVLHHTILLRVLALLGDCSEDLLQMNAGKAERNRKNETGHGNYQQR